MPETIFGLPAHPLIIHLPIVLGPVVGLLTLLMLVPKLRDKLAVPTAALGVLFAITAVAAVISGEDFVATLGLGGAIAEHADAARTLRMLAIILAVLLVLFAIGRKRLPALAATGAVLVVAVLGVATTGFTVKTGHEGATLVWKQQYDAAKEAQQSSSSGDGSSTEDEGSADDSGDASDDASDDGMSPEEHEAMQGG